MIYTPEQNNIKEGKSNSLKAKYSYAPEKKDTKPDYLKKIMKDLSNCT